MKRCEKCGCEIVLGVNGCTLLPVCFDCNGGHPEYPAPVRINYPDSMDYLDYIENLCLSMGETPD